MKSWLHGICLAALVLLASPAAADDPGAGDEPGAGAGEKKDDGRRDKAREDIKKRGKRIINCANPSHKNTDYCKKKAKQGE